MNADEKEGLWSVNNRRGEACLARHRGRIKAAIQPTAILKECDNETIFCIVRERTQGE